MNSRDRVNVLPASFDAAIESAMMNAEEMGLSEEADDDGEAFWAEVLGQVAS
jgi:hypothetical protein